jgi:hypothetical protein
MLAAVCASTAALANATVSQKEWRWRNNDGGEAAATWKAGQEQATSLNVCTEAGQAVRLRVNFSVYPDPSTTNNAQKTVDRYLAYSTSPSGPWTYMNTTASLFTLGTSGFVTDQEPTTAQLTAAEGTFGSGQVITGSNTFQIVFTTPSGVTTRREYEWVIVPGEGIPAGTYYFMLPGVNNYPTALPQLTVYGGQTTATQNILACESYESPSGNYTWTESGSYNDTIPNANGCDSVIVTNLTINTPTYSTQTITACGDYESPSGGYLWTASGTYNDTIPNAAGCDSIITTNLTINAVTYGSITAYACDSYTGPGGNTWEQSGMYTDVIENAAGCDSVITIVLYVGHTTTATDVQSTCGEPFTWINGVTYTSNNNTATYTMENASGCDSVITLDLTINEPNADIAVSGTKLTAPAGADGYQWFDCSTEMPIAGATNSSYTATANGSYAVLVTEGECMALSGCQDVTTLDVAETLRTLSFAIAPNPTSGSFKVQFTGMAAADITVLNVQGRIVFAGSGMASGTAIDLSGMDSGIYLVHLRTANGNAMQRIVKR